MVEACPQNLECELEFDPKSRFLATKPPSTKPCNLISDLRLRSRGVVCNVSCSAKLADWNILDCRRDHTRPNKVNYIIKPRIPLLRHDSHRAFENTSSLLLLRSLLLLFRMQTSSESSSGSAARVEDEKDPEEVKIAKKEEKEIDSVTDFHVEKESEKLSNALLSFTDSSQTEAAK